MSLKTHPDFKSVISSVVNAEDMDDHLFEALSYQYMFDRRTTPWEMQHWDYKDLQAFKIDLEQVDRLYHIKFFENAGDREFEMIGRMQYKGEPLYVELNAGCDNTGFDCQGMGNIFISRDANLFMKLVLRSNNEKDLIYKSLADDGIEVEEEEQSEFDVHKRMFSRTVPMLKYICHEAVYQHEQKLQSQFEQLPKILANSLEEFIRFQEAKKDYDS